MLKNQSSEYDELINIISRHRKQKMKKDKEILQQKICSQIKENIVFNFNEEKKGQVKISKKELSKFGF